MGRRPKVLYLVTEDWYLCSHRLALACATRAAGCEVVAATRIDKHGPCLARAGLRPIAVRLRRREVRPWRELTALLELVRLYRRERPDLVHHVAMKPVLYGSIAAWLAGVPAVVNALAGLGFVFTAERGMGRWLRPPIEGLLALLLRARRAAVIVQNPDDRAVLLALGVPADRVRVIEGSGVDLERFRPTPEPEGPITVALVARMLWDKGVGELVEAARLLRHTHPALRVVLVGEPDPENPASIPVEQLRAWHQEGVVEWRGLSEDVPGVWAAAHIGVLPSYREGLPKSLLEVAASGRPAVATDVPGCRLAVTDGETGLLVPPRDAGALAAAIGRLASDPALRERLGRAARQRAESAFGERRVIDATLALYRELLGARWAP